MVESISTLGSHSALDVCEGAKKEGFGTIVIAQKGRDKTYSKYYKTRKRKDGKMAGVVDQIIMVDKFSEMMEKANLAKLKNSIFVPNRSFAVYVGYDNIENKFGKDFGVPVFGNKYLLRAEERSALKNQYYLLEKAGVRAPKTFSKPEQIDRLSIVKVNEAKRSYERAFFLCRNYDEFLQKSGPMLKAGKIKPDDLKAARIEEYIVGAHFNLNFFYSPINQELELLGIDTRRQTNIDGYLRMPADMQLEALKVAQPSTIEVGHIACTLRESLLEQVFDIGERFVNAVGKEKEYEKGGGLVGPFALQGAFVEDGKEEFVCFDVSFRMPGSPGTRFTPYSEYLLGQSTSFGRRIAIEIKEAKRKKMLNEVIS
ncbi:DUF1297 domain-containing protein [Candidatus Micrarchaeota archaeon]|nr:DUF1297 domain-containing protein [Candidatus Micrarchaeota archaeon]